MSGRKNVLPPILVSSNHSLAAPFSTSPTVITFLDNCAYQINITTSDSTGTFSVEGSLDYVQATANVTGHWIPLTLGGSTAAPIAAGANDQIIINLNQVPFNALRVSYVAGTAGTGHADIYFMSKMV